LYIGTVDKLFIILMSIFTTLLEPISRRRQINTRSACVVTLTPIIRIRARGNIITPTAPPSSTVVKTEISFTFLFAPLYRLNGKVLRRKNFCFVIICLSNQCRDRHSLFHKLPDFLYTYLLIYSLFR